MKKVAKNEKVRKEVGVYFSSFEAFRKALTPKRLELLHTIKTDHPKSINELARITKSYIKNVSDDIKYLEQIGLLEKRAGEKEIQLSINYDRIALEIAI